MEILPKNLPEVLKPVRHTVDVLTLIDPQTGLPIPAFLSRQGDTTKGMSEADLDKLMRSRDYERDLDGNYRRKRSGETQHS